MFNVEKSHLVLGNSVPVEHQVPVEAAHSQVGRLLVGESLVVDDIDDGTDHVGLVPGDPVQQGLQPALGTLAVRVQVGEDLPLGLTGAQQAGSDETDSLRSPDQFDLGELPDVILQLGLQVLLGGGVVHQDDLLQQPGGRPVDDAVDGPEQGAPALVVEADDDGGGGKLGEREVPLVSPAPAVSLVRQGAVEGDQVTDVRVVGVGLPAGVYQLLGLRIWAGDHHRSSHLTRSVRVHRRPHLGITILLLLLLLHVLILHILFLSGMMLD